MVKRGRMEKRAAILPHVASRFNLQNIMAFNRVLGIGGEHKHGGIPRVKLKFAQAESA